MNPDIAARHGATLKALFHDARAQNGWTAEPVSDDELQAAWDIAKWGPTSMNSQPQRIVFLRSGEAKERLRPALNAGNVEKTISAPIVAILAYDMAFPSTLPRLFPHKPEAEGIYAGKDALIQSTAFRNATLQAAYFMLALRAIGLDVGPMSGFDPAKVDTEFFAGTTIRTNMLCGIGRGDRGKLFERSPRLTLAEISQTL